MAETSQTRDTNDVMMAALFPRRVVEDRRAGRRQGLAYQVSVQAEMVEPAAVENCVHLAQQLFPTVLQPRPFPT